MSGPKSIAESAAVLCSGSRLNDLRSFDVMPLVPVWSVFTASAAENGITASASEVSAANTFRLRHKTRNSPARKGVSSAFDFFFFK